MNRTNLTRLRDFLLDPLSPPNVDPKTFHMAYFMTGADNCGNPAKAAVEHNVCGTSACAAGWYALEVMPFINLARYRTWNELIMAEFDLHGGYLAIDWMFGGSWQDNTPAGAAKRITYFMTYGKAPPYSNDLWDTDSEAYKSLPLT